MNCWASSGIAARVSLSVRRQPQKKWNLSKRPARADRAFPVQKVNIDGQVVTLIALPAIFQQFREQGKVPGDGVTRELLDMVKIYNPVPAEQEASYLNVLEREYTAFCAKERNAA